MNNLIAVIAVVVILAVPVGAIIATFRPSRTGLRRAVGQLLAFSPWHPQISYR